MPALEAESGEPLPLPAPPEQDASAGSSGGVDVEGALVAYESLGAPPAVDASVPPAPPEPELRVEDHRVTSSGHGVLGHPGAYRRLHVVCKFHRGCGTQRSFSKKLARWAGVPEEHEPLCFLGAWLKKGRDLDTAAAHLEYRKTMEATEVRAYADTLCL